MNAGGIRIDRGAATTEVRREYGVLHRQIRMSRPAARAQRGQRRFQPVRVRGGGLVGGAGPAGSPERVGEASHDFAAIYTTRTQRASGMMAPRARQ